MIPDIPILDSNLGKYYWEFIKMYVGEDLAKKLQALIYINGAEYTLAAIESETNPPDFFRQMALQAFEYIEYNFIETSAINN